MTAILLHILLLFTTPHVQQGPAIPFATLEKNTIELFKLMPRAVDSEEKGRTYEEELEQQIAVFDLALKAGSGYKFEEMNKIRKYRLYANILKDFVYGIRPGSTGYITGKTIRLTRQLFPDISLTMLTDISTECINVYKLTVGSYVTIMARHEKLKSIYKVNYTTPRRYPGTQHSGNFGIFGGMYRCFWNNASDKSNTNPSIKITACIFESFSEFEFIKPED